MASDHRENSTENRLFYGRFIFFEKSLKKLNLVIDIIIILWYYTNQKGKHDKHQKRRKLKMTTKEQERKALAQIRKIVESLGEDSYVGTAFAGCFEDAEENIENDFAMSYKDRYEKRDMEADRAEKEIVGLRNELELAKKTIKDEVESKNRIKENAGASIEMLEEKLREAKNEAYNERKDLTIELANGEKVVQPFAEVKYINNNGFTFVNVIEKSGWTTSYKMEDIKSIRIA